MAVLHKAASLLLIISMAHCSELGVSQEGEDAEETERLWFAAAPEMQNLAQMSWEYVHELQCWMWPEKCEEMKSDRQGECILNSIDYVRNMPSLGHLP